MEKRSKADYRSVDRDSICPSTGKGHIPSTLERIVDGVHVRFHACKNCGDVIK